MSSRAYSLGKTVLTGDSGTPSAEYSVHRGPALPESISANQWQLRSERDEKAIGLKFLNNVL